MRARASFGGVSFDPGAALRAELVRLRALGVALSELRPASATRVLERVIGDFVQEEQRAKLRAAWLEAASQETVRLENLVRPDTICSRAERSLVSFLTRRGRDATLVRFDRRAGLPAIQIVASTFEDSWAGSWPGLYVGAEGTRIAVITRDYAELRCATRLSGATPYR